MQQARLLWPANEIHTFPHMVFAVFRYLTRTSRQKVTGKFLIILWREEKDSGGGSNFKMLRFESRPPQNYYVLMRQIRGGDERFLIFRRSQFSRSLVFEQNKIEKFNCNTRNYSHFKTENIKEMDKKFQRWSDKKVRSWNMCFVFFPLKISFIYRPVGRTRKRERKGGRAAKNIGK